MARSLTLFTACIVKLPLQNQDIFADLTKPLFQTVARTVKLNQPSIQQVIKGFCNLLLMHKG